MTSQETTKRDEPSGDSSPPPPANGEPAIGRGMLVAAAGIMAVPALIPLAVLIEPSLVPFLGEVDTGDSTTVAFLIGMSIFLLLANWGFIFLIYRWLNRYAGRQP